MNAAMSWFRFVLVVCQLQNTNRLGTNANPNVRIKDMRMKRRPEAGYSYPEVDKGMRSNGIGDVHFGYS